MLVTRIVQKQKVQISVCKLYRSMSRWKRYAIVQIHVCKSGSKSYEVRGFSFTKVVRARAKPRGHEPVLRPSQKILHVYMYALVHVCECACVHENTCIYIHIYKRILRVYTVFTLVRTESKAQHASTGVPGTGRPTGTCGAR